MRGLVWSRPWRAGRITPLFILLANGVLPDGSALAVSVTLDPIKDTYVSQNAGTSNYGSSTTVLLGDLGCGTCSLGVFTQYDLSSIPSGATLVTVTLSFKKASTNHSGTMAVSIRNRASTWSEGGATWNNSNPLGDQIVGSASINTGITYPTITDGPLLTLVQGWLSNPGSNRGLAILPGVLDGTYISFYTKEASGQLPIRLNVEYTIPQSPPSVTTGAATGVGQTAATLSGAVNPNGSSTTAFFDWGLSPGSLTNPVTYGNVGSGTSSVSIASTISGLTCNTQYYFRARATNAGGTSNGSTLSFNTSSCLGPILAAGFEGGTTLEWLPDGSCAHPVCTSGSALSAGCSWCAAQVCAVDPYCCSTSWDGLCVGEAGSICAACP